MENENKEKDNNNSDKKKEVKTSKAYKFIVGFVIAIALLIFIASTVLLLVKIVPDTLALIAGTYQSVTSSDSEEDTQDTNTTTQAASLSVDNSFITSGDTATFSWTEKENSGQYSLTFLCDDEDGINIEYDENFISCGETLFFDQGKTQAEVIFLSDKKRYLDIPVVLEIENEEDGITTLGEIQVTISNKNPTDDLDAETETNTSETETNTTVTSSQPTQTNTTTQSTSVSPSPVRDLSVQMIRAGAVVNGQVVNSSSFSPDALIGVQFRIQNNGNVSTGGWSFQAILPVTDVNSRIFNSGLQNSLAPGSGVVYTLTFSGIQSGTNSALISVDPQNFIAENFEGNNQASAVFTVDGNNYSNGNGQGIADFDIDLIAIGRLSGSRFIETDNLDVRDEIAITFRVTNTGGRETDDWKFEASVDEPRNSRDLDFTSKRYDGLRAGEYREIIISFDDLDEDGDYDFDIEVDPDRDTDEQTRSNNTIRFDIDVDN